MKRYLLGLFSIALLFVGCQKKSVIPTTSGDKGTVSFNLKQDGEFTKSNDVVDVKDFWVKIYQGDNVVKSFDRYSEVPNIIELPAGSYRVEAGSYGDKEAAFSQPIFNGDSDFVIEPGKVTKVNATCSLKNMKVTITCSERFINELKDDFVIVVDNGKAFLNFTKQVILEGTSGYFKVSKLTVTVKGYRKLDNSEVNHVVEIPNGVAKDHHILNFDAQETGEVEMGTSAENGAGGILVDYSVNDRNAEIIIPGEDEEIINDNENPDPEPGTDPDPGTDPEPGTDPDPNQPQEEYLPTITGDGINSKLSFTMSQSTSAVVNVTVTTLNGKSIQHLDVEITSAFLTPEFMSTTDFGSTKFSLTDFDGSEASNKRKAALAEIGLIDVDDPIVGKTTYTFSIGQFVPMLFLGAAEDADNKFTITVEDSDGKKAEAYVNIVKVAE